MPNLVSLNEGLLGLFFGVCVFVEEKYLRGPNGRRRRKKKLRIEKKIKTDQKLKLKNGNLCFPKQK